MVGYIVVDNSQLTGQRLEDLQSLIRVKTTLFIIEHAAGLRSSEK